MSTQAIKTINQIVSARARMVGSQTGPTTEQALAVAKGSFSVVRPGNPTRYVASNGGWTTDPADALTWTNTTDLLRAAYKLNVSGLRIVNAPTPQELAEQRAVVTDATAAREAAIASNVEKVAARRAKRLAAIKSTT